MTYFTFVKTLSIFTPVSFRPPFLSVHQNALPLSAAVFRGPKSVVPSCPPRLDVQSLSHSTWARVPHNMSYVNSLKLSDVRGWSMLSDKTGSRIKLQILLNCLRIV